MENDFVIEGGILRRYAGPGGDVIFPEGVTSIGNFAFSWCSGLTSVTIPDGVTSIGEHAFLGCSSLSSVTIPDGVTSIGDRAFTYCSSLSSVTIPEGVTSIGDYAFSGCSRLSSVTIPESVTSIGGGAFSDCSSLHEIKIPGSVKEIGYDTFHGCENLKSVTLAEGVEKIGERAFSYCKNLANIFIPSSLKEIGRAVFRGCEKLGNPELIHGMVLKDNKFMHYYGSSTSVIIPDGITAIGKEAFMWSGVTSIIIPDSVTRIGARAFFRCDIPSIKLPKRLKQIGASAFGCCEKLEKVTIPEGVKSIGKEAFLSCRGLSSVTIPESVKSIGDNAFSGCSRLSSVTIPESVTSIGVYAFYSCSSLSSVTIPESVTCIEHGAFCDCNNLISIFICGQLDPRKRFNHKIFGKSSLFIISKNGESYNYYAFASNLVSDNFKDFAKQGQWEIFDLEIINNGPKYKYKLPVRLIGGLGRLLRPVELTDKNRKLLVELLTKNVKKIIPIAEAANCPAIVQAIFDLGIVNKKNEKAIRKLLLASRIQEIAALAETSLAVIVEPEQVLMKTEVTQTSPLEKEYREKLNAINGEKTIKAMKLTGITMPAIKLNDGTDAPDDLFRFILAKYGSQIGNNYHFDAEADAAAALLSYDSLCKAMDRVSGHLDGPNYPTVLPVLCRYGSAQQLSSLIKAWKTWGDWRIYNRKGRIAQTVLEESLVLSDTKEAVLWLEKRARLEDYAAVRDISVAEVYETYLFDIGFDESGKKMFDLGTTAIEASLTQDLKIALFDTAKKKIVRSIPKKDIDPAVQKAAANELTDLRQNLKKISKIKNDQLFVDYINGIGISPERWKKSYLHNPLLRRFAELLVWSQGDNSFILTDQGICDVEGNGYEITEESVYLAHPMEMNTDVVKKWQKYFASHGLKQPFSQIWEPVYNSSAINPDRYKGIPIKPHYLKHQEKRGIEAEWYVYEYYDSRKISIDGFDVQAKDAWDDDKDDDELKLQIVSIKPKKWNRRANNVIAFLDRITIYGRIKKDDISVIDVMEGFTLEQVSDFISVAIENKANTILAALMDYKTHFSDFDPMDSFLPD